MCVLLLVSFAEWFFFVKHKTAYEMRISDWSSDVCSSDRAGAGGRLGLSPVPALQDGAGPERGAIVGGANALPADEPRSRQRRSRRPRPRRALRGPAAVAARAARAGGTAAGLCPEIGRAHV